jgi:hypothetical protein
MMMKRWTKGKDVDQREERRYTVTPGLIAPIFALK